MKKPGYCTVTSVWAENLFACKNQVCSLTLSTPRKLTQSRAWLELLSSLQ